MYPSGFIYLCAHIVFVAHRLNLLEVHALRECFSLLRFGMASAGWIAWQRLAIAVALRLQQFSYMKKFETSNKCLRQCVASIIDRAQDAPTTLTATQFMALHVGLAFGAWLQRSVCACRPMLPPHLCIFVVMGSLLSFV